MNTPTPTLESSPANGDQFDAGTPEQLELIDGYLIHGRGDAEGREALLRLLLTNVGVVRALSLAPLETWRRAIDVVQQAGSGSGPNALVGAGDPQLGHNTEAVLDELRGRGVTPRNNDPDAPERW